MSDNEQLLAQLQDLHSDLQQRMMSRWNRDLPFDELLFDRWERARRLGFGEGASIYHNTFVMGDVRIGRSTWVGPFVMLDGRGGIEIGDFCSISTAVHVYSHDSVRWALSGGEAEYELGRVEIGDCTYVGSHSVVVRGVTVGDHCVVGAHSLVNADIPSYSIAFGVPARVRGRVVIDQSGQIEFEWAEEQA
jgi:acetyltransferase-like isoleucine patch superfamily enzyme